MRKIHPAAQMVDSDLVELAIVLDEHRLDASSKNWFSVPWRDGWNAVALAHDFYDADDYSSVTAEEKLISLWIDQVVSVRTSEPRFYWEATDHLQQCTRFETKFLSAALRCLQVMLSHSEGGGHVYNAILLAACDKIVPVELHANLILEHRCRDAIGTTSKLLNDEHDRVRRAFTIAWQRGLYQAAYSLKPVKTSSS